MPVARSLIWEMYGTPFSLSAQQLAGVAGALQEREARVIEREEGVSQSAIVLWAALELQRRRLAPSIRRLRE